MRKRKQLVMLAFAAVVAAVMTACSVEDNANPNPVTSNDPLQVVPVSAAEFQTKVIGGWKEIERRKINADGTLGEVFDWKRIIGEGPNVYDIQPDSIYDFSYHDAYPSDGYLSYAYTYDPSTNTIRNQGYYFEQILTVSADRLITRKSSERVVYERMTKEELEWYWEHYGINLKDYWGY